MTNDSGLDRDSGSSDSDSDGDSDSDSDSDSHPGTGAMARYTAAVVCEEEVDYEASSDEGPGGECGEDGRDGETLPRKRVRLGEEPEVGSHRPNGHTWVQHVP